MANKFWPATVLTGGTAGALDAIDGALLSNGDAAFVVVSSGLTYSYRLNATSGATEGSPWTISPDTNPGNKRWILQDINNPEIARTKNPLALSQGIHMTAGATNPIAVADNDNIDFGTGNFTLRWKGSLPDWTPPAGHIFNKDLAGVGFYATIGTDGKLAIYFRGGIGAKTATVVPGFIDGTEHEIVWVVTRETTITAGSVVFYIDGVQLGASVVIAAGSPATLTNASPLYILGYINFRHEGTAKAATLYNRALTAAGVLSLYRNGVDFADKWGSQTVQTSGTLTANKRYKIELYVAGDDFTNIGGTNVTGNEFVATGTTPTTWTNSSQLKPIGATLDLEPEGAQPAPGQWLDASSNKLHAMQPASGSSLVRPKRDFEKRWTNTWAGTHEAQYIGGVNQAILPVGCYITSIIGVISGATIEDIIVGDGSDTDRWVTITTGLAAGTVPFTIANAISDGTNYKMVVDPDANFTGSIAWTIRGIILQ